MSGFDNGGTRGILLGAKAGCLRTCPDVFQRSLKLLAVPVNSTFTGVSYGLLALAPHLYPIYYNNRLSALF